jgi:hypothetical protein
MRRLDMNASLTLPRLVALIALAGAVQACDAPDPTKRTEEGVYGASSGPNPNLADVQAQRYAEKPSSDAPPPASPLESTYPSQAGQTLPPPTGAEGGRGSAETGATEDRSR